jgi:15-cis-phytoene synthase
VTSAKLGAVQDASAYCAELVRTADRDRFIASLFAPADRRGDLHALYAFNVEVSRVRDVVHEALPGEIRLQWWSEVVGRQRDDEASANPVAAALLTAIDRHDLPTEPLSDLIEAHRLDLYEDPPATLGDLENYARRTASSLIAVAARLLAGVDAGTAGDPAGVASGIVDILRTLPREAARGRIHLPAELLERHGVALSDILAGRSSPALETALAELRGRARERLATAAEHIGTLPPDAVPAFLPVALSRPLLDRLDRSAPFEPVEMSPWRRQWLIWRAARNPARIAG